MMSRKDYQLIARVIREEVEHYREIEGESPITHKRLVGLFVDELTRDNPAFKADVFIRACGF